ncbi:MAG: hypothetical protein KAS36_08490, partial [Anaerolineales bacterium]|nr:hypothetical protein [Anaerolineales bacterium]
AIEGDDITHIKSLQDELQNAFHALSQQLYAQQEQAQEPQAESPFMGGNGNGRSPASDDEGEVVEGEFREA